jgi:hypothetical protein
MRTLEAFSMGLSGSSAEFYRILVSAHTGAHKRGNCQSQKKHSMFHLYYINPFHYVAAFKFLQATLNSK